MSVTLGQVILAPDLDANKPAPGEPGRLFFATDTKIVYRDTGAIWQTVVASSAVYPPAGVPSSTGTAWGSSYTVGNGPNNLPQLNSSGQIPSGLLPSTPTALAGILSYAASATIALSSNAKYLIRMTGSGTLTLPAPAAYPGVHLVFISAGNSVTLAGSLMVGVTGASPNVLDNGYGGSLEAISDGTHWIVFNYFLGSNSNPVGGSGGGGE